jgi:hypothetical protein
MKNNTIKIKLNKALVVSALAVTLAASSLTGCSNSTASAASSVETGDGTKVAKNQYSRQIPIEIDGKLFGYNSDKERVAYETIDNGDNSDNKNKETVVAASSSYDDNDDDLNDNSENVVASNYSDDDDDDYSSSETESSSVVYDCTDEYYGINLTREDLENVANQYISGDDFDIKSFAADYGWELEEEAHEARPELDETEDWDTYYPTKGTWKLMVEEDCVFIVTKGDYYLDGDALDWGYSDEGAFYTLSGTSSYMPSYDSLLAMIYIVRSINYIDTHGLLGAQPTAGMPEGVSGEQSGV